MNKIIVIGGGPAGMFAAIAAAETGSQVILLEKNEKLEEENREPEVKKPKGKVPRNGGTVGEVEEWGKKRLAYEIQHMREAYYYFIQFEADATAPAEIESHMRIMDNVLRYLVVKKEA